MVRFVLAAFVGFALVAGAGGCVRTSAPEAQAPCACKAPQQPQQPQISGGGHVNNPE